MWSYGLGAQLLKRTIAWIFFCHNYLIFLRSTDDAIWCNIWLPVSHSYHLGIFELQATFCVSKRRGLHNKDFIAFPLNLSDKFRKLCVLSILQREAVERAKLALLAEQTGDAKVAPIGGRQSDHLIMLIAYQKWDKILSAVSLSNTQCMIGWFILFSSVELFEIKCTALLLPGHVSHLNTIFVTVLWGCLCFN